MIEINKVYNMDCLDGFKLIDDESIDLICTDPPYRITSKGSDGSAGGMLIKKINKSGKVFNFNDINPSEYAKEFYRVLKNGSHCYVMTNHVNLIDMLNEFTKVGFHFIKSLIWDKGNKIMGRFYMSQFEYILFFRKGEGKAINNCGTSDILRIPNIKMKDSDGSNIHDTEKPVELMKILIENSSNKGDIVLEPFSGTGSTLMAAKELEREYIGFEIDEKYYKVSNNRLNGTNIKCNTKIEQLW